MDKITYIKKLEKILYEQDVEIKQLLKIELKLLEIIKYMENNQNMKEDDIEYVEAVQDLYFRR